MRRFAHIVLPVLGFIAALVIGSWLSIERRAAAFSAGVDQRLASASVAPPIVAGTKRAFSTDAEMLTVIMSALSEDEPLLRAHRVHDALSQLSSAELAVLFTKALQVEDRERRGVLLSVLLTRWSAVDAQAVEAAVAPYVNRYRTAIHHDWRGLDLAVCTAWAAAVPERALAEAMATPDSQRAAEMARAALESLGEGDPLRQLEVLAQLPAGRLRGELCETAIKALAEKDAAAAEAQLDLFPEPRQRARVQAEILGKLAERDPAAGLARLAALAPNLTRSTDCIRLVTTVLLAAAKKDPDAALSAIEGLPPELQSQALGSALGGWAQNHPIDALTWAVDHGVDLSEAKAFSFYGDSGGVGWNSVFSFALQSDRAKTLAWIRKLPASYERDLVLREGLWNGRVDALEERFELYSELTPRGQAEVAPFLVQTGLQHGESATTAWIKAQPAGAARKGAIEQFASFQTQNTPERIEALAAEWPAGPDRDAALRGIASSLVRNDPQRALEFARRVSSPDARQSAFEELAHFWAWRDESAARAWVASAPELTAEEKRVLLRQFDER